MKVKPSSLVLKYLGASTTEPRTEALVLHLQVKWPWASDSTSLAFVFLSLKQSNNSTFLICLLWELEN